MARPTDYTAEMGDRICDGLAAGKSLEAVCKGAGMPSPRTVYRWLRKHDEFRQNYARACEDRADKIFDEIIEIADSTLPDKGDAARNRLRIETRKWVAGRLKPKVYGERVSLEHAGAVSVAQPDIRDVVAAIKEFRETI